MNRSRSGYVAFSLLVVIAILAAALAILRSTGVMGGASERDRAANAAVAYARSTTMWSSGPAARAVRFVPLRRLDSALRSTVSRPIRDAVNVPDLIHRYGKNRRVALVVLTGAYNSLAPDEGVTVHGDVVAVVDTRSNHVLLLTA